MHETIFSPSWGGGAGGGGLINMNGRLYDPLLARMLSPDNYVQAAGNTQSYNRYSYVWNNPLKFTDPSGDVVWFAPILIQAAVGVITNGISNSMNGKPFFQ
jgi:RHS repeat-associated protein